MPGVKQTSKRKRVTKAVPALGAVGLTFSLVGGASASAVPSADTPQTPNMAPGHEITLGEEEMSERQLGDVLRLRQGERGNASGLGTRSPRLRRLRQRVRWLRQRLRRLPSWRWLPRLRCRWLSRWRWLRRLRSWLGSWLGSCLRRLLRVVGSLPLVLKQTAFQLR